MPENINEEIVAGATTPSIVPSPQSANTPTLSFKKIILALGLLAVVVFPSLGYYFFTQNQAPGPTLLEPKKPGIFVAEQVTNAQRPDLPEFASAWQEALEKKLTFDDYKQLTLTTGGRFQNVPVLKIGEETLYGNDLNYLALFYHFQDYITAQKMPEASLNEIVDRAITDSVLLQEGAKQQLLQPSPDYFNNPNKNYRLRNEMVDTAKQLLSDKLVQKVSGEAIAIWFNNNIVPVSTESGKLLAKSKMDALYPKLQSGDITMQQAGDLIKKDKEIGQKIDPAYQNNAYTVFKNAQKGLGPFTMEDLNQQLWSLGEGQIVSVSNQRLFMIIKVNKRTGESTSETTQDMINNLIKQSPKENLNL